MTEALLGLPAHLRRRLADALEAGMIVIPASSESIQAVLGLQHGGEEIASDLMALLRLGMSSQACSVWIRTIEAAVSRTPSPDLVWSGPTVPGIHARDTRRVYEELLGTAERSVLVSTYAYFDGQKAFDALAQRMNERQALRVTLLLNIRRERGDKTPTSELVRRFTDRFWKKDWPGEVRPRVYYDPRSLELDGAKGILHAKAVVVDDEAVFVTSANFTEAAWDRNIELGLLVRDRALAASVSSHFRELINRELLSPLPMS
jgi:phosphatidylserine/phosphatidylglycerophosphate/cardiolipin synthase-like enzyme